MDQTKLQWHPVRRRKKKYMYLVLGVEKMSTQRCEVATSSELIHIRGTTVGEEVASS